MNKKAVGAASAAPDTPWMRLNALLASHNSDILQKEESNSGRIYLYPLGEYWAAFEQSACLLHRMFPDGELTVLHLKTFPFPVVMLSITDFAYRSCSRCHSSKTGDAIEGLGCIVISVPSVSGVDYSRWHKYVVDGVI